MAPATISHKWPWLAALLLIVAGLFWARSTFNGSEPRRTEAVRRDRIIESVYGIGTVKANRSFQFRPGVASTVTRILVKEGDRVAAGQTVLELDRGLAVSAPFEGTVTSLPVKVGENVFPQSTAFEIVDLGDRYVTVTLEQRAAVRVRRGQPARLSFENMRESAATGTVESVYSSGSDLLVRIESPDLPPQVLPGMTADVAIGINERADALLVPAAAIQDGSVRVERTGLPPRRVDVRIGIVDGAVVEIVSGDLEPGDRVVLASGSKR